MSLSVPALLVAIAWAFLMAAAWEWLEGRAARGFQRSLQQWSHPNEERHAGRVAVLLHRHRPVTRHRGPR